MGSCFAVPRVKQFPSEGVLVCTLVTEHTCRCQRLGIAGDLICNGKIQRLIARYFDRSTNEVRGNRYLLFLYDSFIANKQRNTSKHFSRQTILYFSIGYDPKLLDMDPPRTACEDRILGFDSRGDSRGLSSNHGILL